MRVFITGDTHGDFRRVEDFIVKAETTKDDILIILGDVGINYYGGKRDRRLKENLKDLPLTLFCIKGNHENYAGNLKTYEIKEFLGGKVFIEEDYPNLIFAKDGEIYDFNGMKSIVIGGAYSVDKFYRLAMGYKWFEDEQPSSEVKEYVESQLEKLNWNIDLVLSHTAPLRYEPVEWFLPVIDQSTVDKSTEEWLDTIFERLTFKKWYCGHYHGSKIADKINFLYTDIRELK